MPEQTVKPGQVWKSLDKRDRGRRILIQSVKSPYAYGLSYGPPSANRPTFIHLSRMKPIHNGYRLIEEADDAR